MATGWRCSIQAAGLAAAVCVSSSCSGTPSRPSAVAQPTFTAGEAAVSCPSSIETFSPDGAPVAVSFPNPSVSSGGTAIEKAECRPGSGSPFPVGQTSVTCAVEGGGQVLASCNFAVRVIHRRLLRTRFLAFGDSITSGFVPSGATASPEASLRLDWRTLLLPPGPATSYPFKLERLLAERFPGQTIMVENAGIGGEWSSNGRRRLPTVLDQERPEVLLLLEGINDLPFQTTADVLTNLRAMADLARARGINVLLATLTPLSSAWETQVPGIQTKLATINRGVAAIARDLSLGPVVDLNAVFAADPGLLSLDGKHPTDAGHTAIAQAFFSAVLGRYEVVTGAEGGEAAIRTTVLLPRELP
jgi:lysophospholipase L1-like esterase